MSKFEANAKVNEMLVQAMADIKAGNLFLAKSILSDALKLSNKAGTKRCSGFIMVAIQRVQFARA